ncbi:unnamed protein product [Phytomonas sp. EM1]|nr:unnamed protein product [Phytomonas sp. EM1]|eukprot:CCW64892.1 unnamed protein product [Phytomonas sp. isolate EM1]
MSSKAVPLDVWVHMEKPPYDPIMSLDKSARDAEEPKANLVIGAYRDEEGKPYPFKVVRKADRMLMDQNLNYEYLPMAGNEEFVDAAMELLYADSAKRENLAAVQTVGGTGAVYVGAQLMSYIFDKTTKPVYIPSPTWPNHPSIFHFTGWTTKTYRYLDTKTIGLDFQGMKEDIQNAPDGSIILVHLCAHNPTGIDPSHAQWDELVEIFLAKRHFAFFDAAYHGFATGSVDQDAYALRLFTRRGVQNVCSQSFSKNTGLYGERIGTLSVVLKDKSQVPDVKGKIEFIIRRCYTTPPIHGARLVHLILTNQELRKEWEEELKVVSARIRTMRQLLYDNLKELGTPGSWEHILSQIGLFSLLGLTKEQCDYCISHNVFITQTGRANMAGLTERTVKLLAKTIDDAIRLKK